MVSCEVLIVGGGPAGSACARGLRAGGVDVLVLDRKTFPRDKTCAGWITPQVIDELAIDLDEYRRGRTLEPITAFGVALGSGRERIIRYDRPISYGIRRCEFDHYALEKSGARLCLGEPLTSLQTLNGRWYVNGHIEAALVIGAGGHFCPVARRLGAKPGKGELSVAAQEVEFELTDRQMKDTPIEAGIPYLYFCEDFKGYGWYYRKGRYLNVGFGRADKDEISAQVTRFCDLLKSRGKIPADTPTKMSGHAYLLYPHAQRELVADGILLIGDAAGLAYQRSGEGIRPAIESGLMAAESILACRGRTTAADLRPYMERMTARFGDKSARSVVDLMPFGLQRFLATTLMRTEWFCRNVVVDQWFLNRKELAYPSPAPLAPASAAGYDEMQASTACCEPDGSPESVGSGALHESSG